MSGLHLVRIPIDVPKLLRFAREHGILQEDETLGYTLHGWLAALFGNVAPKPFRYFERRHEVLAYARADAATLLAHAQAYASPHAWAALDPAGVFSKPMPEVWRQGQRLRLEVFTCPVSRQEGEEKDIYLRALDRYGDDALARSDIYRAWFARQWVGTAVLGHIELIGMQARSRLLRRDRSHGGNRVKVVERPLALLAAEATVEDGERFAALLARGIGRHRAFGLGMVLLSPPSS
jgi:CRISPR system Cascade subunit CasE